MQPGILSVVNAEVDSMGGAVGDVLDVKSSPHREAIEKTQAELRYKGAMLILFSYIYILFC